jgi:hypothetical protein
MSIKTWVEEFYPQSASSVDCELDAVKHSIKKWEGLRKEALNRHDVMLSGNVVREVKGEANFHFDADNCSLCVISCKICPKCPLAFVRGGIPCTTRTLDEIRNGSDAPWRTLYLERNPEPMLEDLHKALLYVLSWK